MTPLQSLTEISQRDLTLLRERGIVAEDEIVLRDSGYRFYAINPAAPSQNVRPLNVEGLFLESNRKLLKD